MDEMDVLLSRRDGGDDEVELDDEGKFIAGTSTGAP